MKRQDHAHLCGDPARIADDVPPAVPQDGFPSNDRDVVAPHVTEQALRRMRFAAVQFDHDIPCPVSNIAVPAATESLHFHLVARALRQMMSTFDIASIALLQWRGDAVVNVGQYLAEQCTPRLPRALRHPAS